MDRGRQHRDRRPDRSPGRMAGRRAQRRGPDGGEMTAVQSIATVGDFYVPAFELRLRGRPVAKDVIRDVISVTYKDNVAEIDSFEVVINNWDAGSRAFKYSDDTLFDPGAEVNLRMGYR